MVDLDTLAYHAPVGAPRRTAADRRSTLIRVLVHVTWVLGLAAAVVARVARFGFTPADQGFILAGSWRLLHGEIPHADVISGRPLGSAVLHMIDFLSPAPLFISSVYIAMVQIIVFTIACAALLTGTSPLRWGPLRTLLVAAASLINLHLFTLMAWHTIDGLMLTALGWWLLDAGLRSESTWQRRIGLFLLGFAVMTKQSFALAVPIGMLLLFLHPAARKQSKSWGRIVVDLLCLGAFPLLYVAVVSIAGGFGDMIKQLTGGAPVYGRSLFTFWGSDLSLLWSPGHDWRRQILLIFAAAVVIAVLWVLRDRLGKTGVWLRILLAGGAALLTAYAIAQTKLTYPPFWSIKIAWLFVAVILLDAVINKRFPWRALLLAVLAFSASLSWGYDYPALLAGTFVIATLELLVAAVPEVKVVPTVVTALVGVLALGVAGYGLVRAHDRTVAADLTHDKLTVNLGSVTPEMNGIRTSPGVATYVQQIKDCVQRYPADKVAVLPDNNFAYPVMKLNNPFPLDWPLHLEMIGDARQRMLDTAEKLNRDGDYLVMFQTVTVTDLRKGLPVPTSVPPDAPVAVDTTGDPVVFQVRDRLTGQRTTCGSFTAVYAPAR
ncbi:hypothetical protein [Kibdelosporangium philippinense]|uniref:hypothetical protein n=1 Tax=Kibdelosporangium philippinense TaxID=211113 RepID=UPI0035EAC8B3